jgi:transposase
MIATALVCAIGDGKQFKRGDAYLRTLLIHSARSVLNVAGKKDDPRSRWLNSLCGRHNKNIAAVALANKNARIAWALLSKEIDYLSPA